MWLYPSDGFWCVTTELICVSWQMSQAAHAFIPSNSDFGEEFKKELSRPRREIDQMDLNCDLKVVLFSLHTWMCCPFWSQEQGWQWVTALLRWLTCNMIKSMVTKWRVAEIIVLIIYPFTGGTYGLLCLTVYTYTYGSIQKWTFYNIPNNDDS